MLVGSSSQQSQLALGQSKGGTHQGLWSTDHTIGIRWTPALSPGFGKGGRGGKKPPKQHPSTTGAPG